MKKNFYFKWRGSALSLRNLTLVVALAVGAIFNVALAQRISTTGGTYTIDATGTNTGTNFITFTDAINDLNFGGTFTGTVTINVLAGQVFNENTPAITATGGSGATIIFQKSGAGVNPVITSLGSTTSLTDAGITIKGGDYFTFNGIDIAAADSSLEYGYLITKAATDNGANFVTITNATIVMNKLKLSSYGVLQTADSIITSQTAFANPSLMGVNSNNTYTNLTIGNSFSGIWLKGISTTYRDSNNVTNNNTIGRAAVTDDIGGSSGSVSTYGIYGTNQNMFVANSNTIQNATSAYYLYCIYTAGSINVTHNNNYITSVKNTGSYWYVYGIYFSNVTGGTINNNTITSFNAGPLTYVYGVYLATATNVTVNANSINNVISYVIYAYYGATITGCTVSNNTLNNCNGTSSMYCYYHGTATNSRITANSATDILGSFTYLFYTSGGTGDTVDNNYANNVSVTSTLYCLYNGTATNFRIYNNTITNASSTTTIYANYTATPTNTDNHHNTFRNIKTTLGTFYAQYITTSAGTNKIYNNLYSDLGATATSTASVYGMYFTNATTGTVTNKVYNNVINGLIKTFTGAATATRYLHGIYFATTSNATCSYELVHNSVSINGSAALTSSSQVIYTAPTGGTSPIITLRNNIFANLTTAQTGAAKHYLIWANGTGLVGNASSSSNYNDWFIADTANGKFGYNGGDKDTLAAWQATTGFTTFDLNSITTNPMFNSATNSRMVFGSPVTNTGSFITGYTDDILGTLRNTSTPSIGAYEVPKDETAPVINFTPALNVYSTSNNVLTAFATISDNAAVNVTPGVAPRIYFKTKSNANTFGGNTSATNGWKWVEAGNVFSPFDFTIDYTLLFGGSASVGDTIEYFIVAQDTAAIANVSAKPSAGFTGTSVAAITTAPTTPSSYIVFGTPAAYVGAVATQPTLSKVGQGSSFNTIVRVAVTTAPTGSPAYVSLFGFNTNGGGNDSANIASASVYYTGASTTFNTSTLFGTTTFSPVATGPIGAFNVNGNQLIPNGTTYFWLVYTLRSAAVIGDSVDGELTSVTYTGAANPYSGGANAGTRAIRAEYCGTSLATTPATYEDIGNVTLVTGGSTVLNNGVGTPILGNLTAVNGYTNFTTSVAPAALYRNQSVNMSMGLIVNGGFSYNNQGAVYIDYNQDGDFADAGEMVWNSINNIVATAGPFTGTFTPPCGAVTGETRMRVVLWGGFTTVALTQSNACGNYTYGETEDYTISIMDNPVAYVSADASQPTGIVSQGATDAQMMRIPVKAKGCGVGVLGAMHFNTSGTTSAADITSAKLYATGNNAVFNTSKLLGTVAAPSGSFSFTALTDTLLTGTSDTNNYWLVYDIGAGAPASNVVDARVDSIQVIGAYVIPGNNDPAGNRQISVPMTYVSSTTSQPSISTVETNSANNAIVKVEVVMSATGAPVNATSFDVATTGTTALADITNLKVWYTGSSSTFAATTQFGATVAAPAATQAVTGAQLLTNGSNYFWVTYDIASAATIANVVDGEVTSVTVGAPQTPTVTSPAGTRLIRVPYCPMAATNTSDEEIGGVTFGSLTNNAACATLAPGAGSVADKYSNYSGLPATNVLRGSSVPLSLTLFECGTGTYTSSVAAYIDYNSDGDFTDAGEQVFTSINFTGVLATNGGIIKSGTVNIPCTAVIGETRLRIAYGEQATAPTSCGTVSWGEVEDYTINIIDNPVAFNSSTAMQVSGVVAPGTTDVPVLRVPVKVVGCGTGIATEMRFNTSGTTATANITNAKLYATGNSTTFNTTRLVATAAAPGATFSFTGLTDTLLTGTNDTNNYWLAFDVSASAPSGNTLDAGLDSIFAVGAYRIPTVGSPAGNRLVEVPMTYVSSTVTQANISKVETNSANNAILRYEVITSATGAPIGLTALDIATTGTDSLPDITNLKVWYTGSSATFAATAQFGSTVAAPAATQTVTGSQLLSNGSNYFWVTYDIASAPTLGHVVDGELTSAMISGSPVTPSAIAPAGNRQIRAPYCGATANNFSDEDILGVTLGSLSNSAACATLAPGAGSVADKYSNYTGLTPANILRGSTVPISLLLGECGAGTYTSSVGAYIDYNGDGDFTDAGELVFSAANFTGVLAVNGGIVKSGNVTIPCGAALGETRFRVVYGEQAGVPASCGTVSWGEAEDYTINIQDNPIAYTNSSAMQVTGVVAPSTADAPVLRIPVKAGGCGVGTVTDMTFNTSGTTVVGDIVNAKLYATGNSASFNTSKLLGTVAAPSGSFNFTALTDTLLNGTNDTNNYWLVFDIAPTAVSGNFIDARIDSVYAVGAYRVPTNNDPAGNRMIEIPMTFISSTVSQPNLSKVETGSANNMIVKYEVVTSATGAPINLTTMDIATTGTSSLADITNLKVFYTGTSSIFATTTQYGATVATPAATQTVTGALPLTNGTNYLWVTYDIPGAATIANLTDAEITSATIGGAGQIPTVTAPSGTRQIRAPYCASNSTIPATYEDIGNVTLVVGGTTVLNNGNATPTMSNPTALNGYTNFSALTPANIYQGQVVNHSIAMINAGAFTYNVQAAIYIDYNQDGDFSDANEMAWNSTTWITALTGPFTGNFAVPVTALTGETRMRVVLWGGFTTVPLIQSNACGTYNYGETEDYTINIVQLPPSSAYVWNQTGSADYNTAANWTPARTTPLSNDILIVNGGGSITMTGVSSQSVKSLYITNSTNATMSGTGTYSTTDSLTLETGSSLTSGLTAIIGIDTNTIGVLNGTGKYSGVMTRWTNAATASYVFPLAVTGNNRALTMTYTTAPSTAGSLTVKYTAGAPGGGGLPTTDASLTLSLANIADAGIWEITNTNGLAGGTFDAVFNADAIGGVIDAAQTAIVYRNGGFGSWTAVGTATPTTGTSAAMILNRSGYAAYGQFGIAGTSTNPLPVTLTSFTAKAKATDAIVSWATASELNNKGFEVERSVDGRSFEKVTFVEGAGNSTTKLNYSITDARAFAIANSNVLYYRLKQVDFNGKFTYSNTVRVNRVAEKATSMSAYPNPFNTSYNVSFDAAEAGAVTITMLDMQGRLVTAYTAKTVKGSNEIVVDNIDQLHAGIYFVHVTVDGETEVLKLVKN
jgi:hypothetical protein